MTDAQGADRTPGTEQPRIPAPAPAAWVRDLTPARVYLGRAGTSYPTATLLALRAAHAAARDAVAAPLALAGAEGFVHAHTQAQSREQYLRRPDLGRRLSEQSRQVIRKSCEPGVDVQVVVGDGLSAAAVHTQAPALLPKLLTGCAGQGWSTGTPILVRHCRVGVINDIGDLLAPRVVVLLIGERPGLATAESLSAYLGYRPRTGHTDAERNLISNIHADGVPVPAAAVRILAFISALMASECSGVDVKEPPYPELSAAEG